MRENFLIINSMGVFQKSPREQAVMGLPVNKYATKAEVQAAQTTTLEGDVTGSGQGTFTTTIANDAVSNAKLTNMAESTIKGRAASAGTGDPTDLTATQATAILNAFTGDSGSGGLKGLVPAPVSGDATKFLKGDGTWASPSGSGDVSSNTSSSVDSELVLFSGVGGKTIKRATTTGLLKGTSGVLSAATAGTDYYAPGSTDVAVADGGTGASDASGARTNLGLVIGTNVQAFDATLTSIAALGTAADKIAYTTGIDTWAETALTSYARTLLDDASASDARTTLGLAIGTNVQAYDATLASIAALGTAAGKIAYTTGVDTWAETAITTFGRSLIDDAAASDARTTLGLVIGTDVLAASAYDDATAGETTTGTSTAKYVSPDGLAGSDYGKRVVSILVSDPQGSAITTGDGKASLRIDAALNGYNLVGVAGGLTTVSSSGIPTFQLRRSRRNTATTRTDADMLSTKLTIDASDFDSVDAATAAVIDTANDDVATGDMIYIDIDVAGTGAKGPTINLEFQLP